MKVHFAIPKGFALHFYTGSLCGIPMVILTNKKKEVTCKKCKKKLI